MSFSFLRAALSIGSVATAIAAITSGVGLGGTAIAQTQGWPDADDSDRVFLYPEDAGSPASTQTAQPIPIYPPTNDGADNVDTSPVPIYPDDALPPASFPASTPTVTAPPVVPSLGVPLGKSDDDSDAVVVRSLQVVGARALTPAIAQAFFRPQINRPFNPALAEQSALAIDQWYVDNGYALSQVVGIMADPSGVLIVEVAEPQVNQVVLRYVDDTGSDLDENGDPIEGRTRDSFVRRELELQPGELFNQNAIVHDIRQLMALGLFENATVAVNVDDDTAPAPLVDVTYSLQERLSRSFQASGGVSTELGLFAGVNYRDNNVGGVGESLRFGTQVGSRGVVFNAGFTSPYRDSRPNRLGYDVRAFRSTGQSITFSDEVGVANGDDARERRLGGGVSVMRPIGRWDGELGLNYSRVSIRDESSNLAPEDELGNALTLSDSGIDDLFTVEFAVTQDERVNPSNPNDGSVLTLSTEQSIPVGNGNITMNRLQANYAEYVPVGLFKTGRMQNPEVVAFNVQAGTILGDLPPYESFNLGGSNSVRGYGRGDVGSGRRYVLASAEYRFPVVGPLGGVVFTDFATDLGSGSEVPGDPAGARDKPGTGFGYGFGLRVGSPLGLIRADFGFNDQGENRFHFGFGQRF